MTSKKKYGNVVTTIQKPTSALIALSEMAKTNYETLFIVGDKKTPVDFYLSNSKYFGTDAQEALDYKVVKHLPWNSYTRKMLGYLEAAKESCDYIRETDDDNFPMDSFFFEFENEITARTPSNSTKWINPYVFFSTEYIWPRGYPIENVALDRYSHLKTSSETSDKKVSKTGVVQGMADGEPDVDAIYRLTYPKSANFKFRVDKPIVIPRGTFAPFNSQVTTWNVELLPLMYLPQTCTFRMTDIWRSFIAIHLMHESDYDLIFTGASAFQERNEHNLLRDFSDEVPGYLGNDRLVDCIKSTKINGGMDNFSSDLLTIYINLTDNGFFRREEIECLESWLIDCDSF